MNHHVVINFINFAFYRLELILSHYFKLRCWTLDVSFTAVSCDGDQKQNHSICFENRKLKRAAFTFRTGCSDQNWLTSSPPSGSYAICRRNSDCWWLWPVPSPAFLPAGESISSQLPEKAKGRKRHWQAEIHPRRIRTCAQRDPEACDRKPARAQSTHLFGENWLFIFGQNIKNKKKENLKCAAKVGNNAHRIDRWRNDGETRRQGQFIDRSGVNPRAQ